MKKELKDIIKLVMTEGRVEKITETPKELVSRLKDRVMIFFDTETTGLNPRLKSTMITELAAVAYDTSTGERLDQYSMKAHLNPTVKATMEDEKRAKEAGKWDRKEMQIADILHMTKYHEGDVPFQEEDEMLRGYVAFVNSFGDRNPLLVAHNAKFDMYQIGKALERHSIQKPRKFEVLDTMRLTTNFLFPILAVLENRRGEDEEIDALLTHLRPERRFLNRLGNLGTAFKVKTEHWHSAIADAEQLAGITSALVKFIESRHEGTDIQLGRDVVFGRARIKPSGEVEKLTPETSWKTSPRRRF